MFISPRNTPIDTPRTVFDQTSGPLGLTHETSHRSSKYEVMAPSGFPKDQGAIFPRAYIGPLFILFEGLSIQTLSSF